MRFKQVIDEAVSTGAWKALQNMLDKNCMPYINFLKGCDSLLLRGSKKSIKMFDKVDQRQDRKPALIGKELSVIMDDWTKDNWGFRARSQSAFATNRIKASRSYGHTYLMFPIGKFDYAWNDDVGFLYGHYDSFDYLTSEKYLDINKNSASKADEISHEEADKLVFDEYIVPQLNAYTVNKGLNTYLKGDNWNKTGFSECIVHCKSYYLINMEWDSTLLSWYTDRHWKKK
jgi:hypothetical protein